MTAISDRPSTAPVVGLEQRPACPPWCDPSDCEPDADATYHRSAPLRVVEPTAEDEVEHDARTALRLKRTDHVDYASDRWHRGEVVSHLSYETERGGLPSVGWADYTPATARRLAEALTEVAGLVETAARRMPDVRSSVRLTEGTSDVEPSNAGLLGRRRSDRHRDTAGRRHEADQCDGVQPRDRATRRDR